MTRLPEASAEPRHIRGGAGGAVPGQDEPSWYRQKVKVPKRVWGEGRYSPGAVAWHAQITALQKRPERCRASVDRLAGYMGDGKRTGERYLRELHAPGRDGIPELTTIRHTDSTGDGETAERYTRALGDGHYAYVPVLAAKALRHPLFVLYCALTYAVATRTPVTAAELGALLGVTELTARRMTTELEALGWITVHRRTGAHGRNEYEIHDRPLHPAPHAPEDVSPNGGSGACADGGSLAIKEDPELTDVENPPTAGLGIRRRRPTGSSAPERPGAVDTFGRRTGLDLTPARWRTVWQVLDPVRHELEGLTGWEWQRIVHDVLRRLDDGESAERLHDRLQRRYAAMRTGPAAALDDRPAIRSIARWVIGAGLIRHGCEDPDCETGTTWSTGADCPICALRREATAARVQRDAELDQFVRQTDARPPQPPHQQPAAPVPAPRPPSPPGEPPSAPTGRVGAPPHAGGWRALVARERPQAAAAAYRHRWTGDHAHHLHHPDTA